MTEKAKTPSGANAPYKIKRKDGEWVVVNNTGETKAKFGQDRDKALRYLRALYVNVPGAPKRASKVKYTGKAKDRVAASVPEPHPFIKASGNVHQAPPLKKDTGNGGLTRQVIDTDPKCVVCGMKAQDPIHNSAHPSHVSPGPLGEQQAVPKLAQLAADENQDGVMVALYPPNDLAGDLALDDESAEDPDELHVTLAYLGKLSDLTSEQQDRLTKVVEGFAHTAAPLDAVISGYGVFAPPSSPGAEDVTPVTYLSVDAPDLPSFRQRLVEALQAGGFPVAMNHGYTPHMTLAYGDMAQIIDVDDVSVPVEFDEVSLVLGAQRLDFDLTAPDTDDEGPEAAAEAMKMADGKFPISDQKSANSAWKLRNHSTTHSEADVVAHIRKACKALGLKFPGDDTEKSVEEAIAKTKKGKHRFVGKQHLKSNVYRGAGWFGGACAACGKDANDPDHDGDVDALGSAGAGSVTTQASADDEQDAGKMAQGLDAAIDQALTLLRSVSSDDLPPYAAQARDLLQGVEETCDALLEYFGVTDSDEEPDDQDAAAGEKATSVATHTKMLAENVLRFAQAREVQDRVDPVPLETIKAFLTEVDGKTIVTAPASTRDLGMWEKALTPNEHMLWIQGRFVGADEPNRNGAFWSSADLEHGASTVPFGPLNWLHDGRKIIGCIADQRMVYPDEQAAASGLRPHIAAVSAMYRWVYPEEAAVIEMAAERGSLWYSMECVSKEIACVGDLGCGRQVAYMDYVKGNGCAHMTNRTGVRQLIDPTFLGGAVIVPPARPGWADADATTMRQAAMYAEQAAEQMGTSDLPGFEIERLLAEVLRFAHAA